MSAGLPARASETDAFTFRYTEIEDATPLINAEVNRRIDAAIDAANGRGSCRERRLMRKLKRQLRRKLYGKIEGWINANPEVPKVRVPLDQGVYRRLRWREAIPMHLGKMGFGSVMRLNGFLVGTDKFGHFFDEGFHYYKAVERSGKTIPQAMRYGIKTENGFFGMVTTGVKSYADMTANFNGMRFWTRMLGDENWAPEGTHRAVDDPYIRCEDGQWVRGAQFDLLEYVDAGWDEGINCSEFRAGNYEAKVMSVIHELEARDGKPYACPVAPQECVSLAAKYGEYAETLLHPKCMARARFAEIIDPWAN